MSEAKEPVELLRRRSSSSTRSPPASRRRASCAASPRASCSARSARWTAASTSRRAARARSTACPSRGDTVELTDKGTLVTYAIVRVPSENIPLELPYISAQVLLDGADTVLMHLLKAKLEDVHMGMRVKATWRPKAEWTTSVGNILYFEPIAEPDAAYDSYKEHI